MNERQNQINRSPLWKSIYSKLSQLRLQQTEGDSYDIPSAATDAETITKEYASAAIRELQSQLEEKEKEVAEVTAQRDKAMSLCREMLEKFEDVNTKLNNLSKPPTP